MESNFFSGSENLYKYLVSIGLLMVVLSIYYPLNEKQTLQISSSKIRAELKAMSYEIDENQKNVDKIEKRLKIENLTEYQRAQLIEDARKLTNKIMLKQFTLNGKIEEVEVRESFVSYYKWIMFVSIPIGIFLMIWGFGRWKIARKNEDEICVLEKKLLELQITKETNNISSLSNVQDVANE